MMPFLAAQSPFGTIIVNPLQSSREFFRIIIRKWWDMGYGGSSKKKSLYILLRTSTVPLQKGKQFPQFSLLSDDSYKIIK
jgi:hypothetical protein